MNPLRRSADWEDAEGYSPPDSSMLSPTTLSLYYQYYDAEYEWYVRTLSPVPAGSVIEGVLDLDARWGSVGGWSSGAPPSTFYFMIADASTGEVLWSKAIPPMRQATIFEFTYETHLSETITVPATKLGGRSLQVCISTSPDTVQSPAGYYGAVSAKLVFRAILAYDDAYTVRPGDNALPVLTNDMFLGYDEGEIAGYEVVPETDPAHGAALPGAPDTLQYTPTTGYIGPDAFRYSIQPRYFPQWFLQAESVDFADANSADAVLTWQNPSNSGLAIYPNDYADGVVKTGLDMSRLVFKSGALYALPSKWDPETNAPALRAWAYGSVYEDVADGQDSAVLFNVGMLAPSSTFTASQVEVASNRVRLSGATVYAVGNADNYYFRLIFTHPEVVGDIIAGYVTSEVYSPPLG